MLPRDIPDGPWQEIAADYLTHRVESIYCYAICLASSPFLYKVSTKSAQSLCACLQELTLKYGLPYLLYTDNGLPFTSKEFAQTLQCNHIDHGYFIPLTSSGLMGYRVIGQNPEDHAKYHTGLPRKPSKTCS